MALSLPQKIIGATASLNLLLAACSHPLPPAAYRDYVADPAHGLLQTQEANGAIITCSYQPAPLLVLQEFNHSALPNTLANRDSLARIYAGKTHCILSFSRDGSEIENAFVTEPTIYQQTLNYLNTGLAKDAYLGTTPRDSVQALASMYIRQFGNTGRSTVLLVFDTSKLHPEDGFRLTLNAQRLNLGTLRFPFSSQVLAKLPPLQFD